MFDDRIDFWNDNGSAFHGAVLRPHGYLGCFPENLWTRDLGVSKVNQISEELEYLVSDISGDPGSGKGRTK